MPEVYDEKILNELMNYTSEKYLYLYRDAHTFPPANTCTSLGPLECSNEELFTLVDRPVVTLSSVGV